MSPAIKAAVGCAAGSICIGPRPISGSFTLMLRERPAQRAAQAFHSLFFDQIARTAYGAVRSPSSEAAPRRPKKEEASGGARPASPSSHGAAPLRRRRGRILLVAPLLALFIPPPHPPPCASELCLHADAWPFAARGGGGRVLRQPASRGARSHRIREGDRASDPRRRRPHHPRGRGSCGLVIGWKLLTACGVLLNWLCKGLTHVRFVPVLYCY